MRCSAGGGVASAGTVDHAAAAGNAAVGNSAAAPGERADPPGCSTVDRCDGSGAGAGIRQAAPGRAGTAAEIAVALHPIATCRAMLW